MSYKVDAAKNPEMARFAREVSTDFERLRVDGVGKVTRGVLGSLPTDNSINYAIVSGTSNGTVPAYFDGTDWRFVKDDTVIS